MRLSFRLSLPSASFVALQIFALWTISHSHCKAQAAQQTTPASEQSTIAELSDEEQQQVKNAERFLTVLEKNPRRGTALDRVYGHHVEFGTLDKFIASLKQRADQAGGDGALWMLVGLFESQRGSDADAIEAFKKAEQLRPQDPMACFYLGQAQVRLGDSLAAAQSMERAIERKPQRTDQLEIYQTLGRVHQRAQRTAEALQVWQRLEKQFPSDARVLEQIAVTLAEENQIAEALPRYEKLAELVDDDYRRVVFQVATAELTIKSGKKPDGIAKLESILGELNPTSWLYRDVRRRIDDVFLRSGDQDGLVKYYQAWLEKNSEDVEGMSRLARFLAGAARVPEALEWLEKALNLAPSRADLRKTYIDLLAGEQRFDQASKQYAELLKAAPTNPDYLRDWGKMVMRNREIPEAQRRDEAFAIWNRMIDPSTKDAVAVSQVADLCRQNQLPERAEELYRRAVELAPNDPQYREYLGEFLHIQKRSEDALKVWNEIASGDRRNVTNLARLAEVFNSFGFSDKACEQIAEAVKLDGKDFSLLLKAADYHTKANKYDDALSLCDKAVQIAANEDEREEIIRQRISVLQANQTLEDLAEKMLADLRANEAQAKFEQWYQAARYLESGRKWADATYAIDQALKLDTKSVLALTTSARIAESSGDYGRAANLNRQLAEVDRRSQGDHLMNVSRLEAQLGRTAEALAAAEKLIIAAPSKTENYEFYAQTCFRLGKAEEGLQALRKAMRINPNEPHLMSALAAALADQMRAEESIEVYWRAFEKLEEVEDRTSLMQRIAPLYQQINQTDKLFERLERGRQEEENRRQFTICIAQAWQTLGDLSAARKELESLLSENTRDTNLLNQLSKLCDNDGDLESAINYQRQLVGIAPGDETESPLAGMLVRNSMYDEAKEIYSRLIQREEDLVRQLRSIDSLIANGNYDTAIQVIEPLLEQRRDDWELLYRQGVCWGKLNNRNEAINRFERLLAMTLNFETLGQASAAKLKQAQAKAKSDNLRGIQTALPQNQTPLSMTSLASQVSLATGLTPDNRYYAPGQAQPIWMPEAYGTARMAALGWMMRFEQDEVSEKILRDSATAKPEATEVARDTSPETLSTVEKVRERAKADAAPRNAIYDWLYVSQLKSDFVSVYEVTKRLAKTGGKEEQRFFLSSLKLRDTSLNNQNRNAQNTNPKRTPLSEEDLKLVETCFKALTTAEKDIDYNVLYAGNVAYGTNGQVYVNTGNGYQALPGVFRGMGGFLSTMIEEYRLAGKNEQADQLIQQQIADSKTTAELITCITLFISEKRYDELMPIVDRWQAAALKQVAETPIVSGRNRSPASSAPSGITTSISNLAQRWMSRLADDEDNGAILQVLDKTLPVSIAVAKHRIAVQSAQARGITATSATGGSPYSVTMYGSKEAQTRAQLSFPSLNNYIDINTVSMLRQAFESLKRNDTPQDLTKYLKAKLESADANEAIYWTWYLASVQWWMEENDDAMVLMAKLGQQLSADPSFKFTLAGLHQSRNEFDEALAVLETIAGKDQQTILRREMLIMQLAERIGDMDRSRESAQKVFGLRMDSQTQQSLVAQMRRLGLNEMADAILARFEKSAGRQVDSQVTLMNLYSGQGKSEQALQVANTVLRKTTSQYSLAASRSNRNPARYSSSDSQSRNAAIQYLSQSGSLKTTLATLKEQFERTPDSVRILEQLIEFSIATNQQEDASKYLERAVELRPDGTIYRWQLAVNLMRRNKASEACDQYLAILKTNPSWISDSFYEVDRAFQQAKRRKELLETMATVDIRKFGQPYYVINLASNMLNEPQSVDIAVKLLERLLTENSDMQSYLSNVFQRPEVFKNEKIYKLVKQSIIPNATTVRSNPWFGIDTIRSYGENGKANSTFIEMLNALKTTPYLKDFEDSLKSTVDRYPDWHGGQALVGILEINSGNSVSGLKRLESLSADKAKVDSMSSATLWLIGQELAELESTQTLASTLLEKAVSLSSQDGNNQPNYTPLGRLVELYSSMPDKKDQALKLLREQITRAESVSGYNDPQYESYQRISTKLWIAQKLQKAGGSIEAIQVLRKMAEDKAALTNADTWYGGGNSFTRQVENAIGSAMKSLDSENANNVVGALLPNDPKAKLDLLVSVPSLPSITTQTINSGLVEMLSKIAKNSEIQQLISARIKELAVANPEDRVALQLSILWQVSRDELSPESFKEYADMLLQVTTFEPIEEGRKLTSRQRKDALPIIDLWLSAKKALQSPKLADDTSRQLAAKLAERALEAASRQQGAAAQLAILNEWASVLVELEKLNEAEKKWTEALNIATKITNKPPANDAAGQVGAGQMGAGQPGALVPPPAGRIPATAPANRNTPAAASTAGTGTASNSTTKKAPAEGSLIAPLSISQFRVTMHICKSAAKHNLSNLAGVALSKSLQGGFPVPDPDLSTATNGPSRIIRSSSGTSADPIEQEVSKSLQDLFTLWSKLPDDSGQLYDVVQSVVLPANRPSEIRLFLNPINSSNAQDCLGTMLIQIAVKKDKLDELATTLKDRKTDAANDVFKKALLTLIAIEKKDLGTAKELLVQLAALKQGAAGAPAIQAALIVGLRAFANSDLADEAIAVLGLSSRVAQAAGDPNDPFSSSSSSSSTPNWIRKIEREIQTYNVAKGNAQAAQQMFENQLAKKQTTYSAYAGNEGYASYLQRNDLMSFASEAFKVGIPEYAIDLWGRAADLEVDSRWGGPVNDSNLLLQAKQSTRKLIPAERYNMWLTWSMPKENRQTLRLSSGLATTYPIPPRELLPPNTVVDEPSIGLQSNLVELVNAAAEAGKLDELAEKTSKLVDEKLDNAKLLQALIWVKQAKVDQVSKTFNEMLTELPKRLKVTDESGQSAPNIAPETLLFQECLRTEALRPFAQSVFIPFRAALRKASRTDYESALNEEMVRHLIPSQSGRPALANWISSKLGKPNQNELWEAKGKQIVYAGGSEPASTKVWQYPLDGDFKISFEVGRTNVGVGAGGFGGLWLDLDSGRLVSSSGHDFVVRRMQSLQGSGTARVAIELAAGQIRYLVDGREVYQEKYSGTYPWLSIAAERNQTLSWQNFSVEGAPLIPREVSLLKGDAMDGWNCQFMNGSQPRKRLMNEKAANENDEISYYQNEEPTDYDWQAKNDVLVGTAKPASSDSSASSWIYYQRAVRDGESIRYQYFYKAFGTVAHPALGRLAFLLAPEGVKTRFIFDSEATSKRFGLEPDNLKFELQYQKNGGSLPLKSNEWNDVELKLVGSNVQIILNGTLVFERPVDESASTVFGFYRQKQQDSMVRNIRMSGNWPEKFEPAMINQVYEMSGDSSDAYAKAMAIVTNDETIRVNAGQIAREARQLPPEQALEMLKAWVIPSETNRLRLYFSVRDGLSGDQPAPTANPPLLGRSWLQLDCPAVELVRVAQKLGKTEQISKLIEQRAAGQPELTASAKALQTLLAIESKQDSVAEQLLKSLQESIDAGSSETGATAVAESNVGSVADPLPTYTACFVAALGSSQNATVRPQALAIAEKLQKLERDENRQSGNRQLGRVIGGLLGDLRLLNQVGDGNKPVQPLKQWTAVDLRQGDAMVRDSRASTWLGTNGKVQHYPAESFSQLYFQSPLRGKFEITADRTTWGYKEVSIGYGMHAAEPNHDQQNVKVMTLMRSSNLSGSPLDVPDFKAKDVSNFKIQVDGNTVTTWTNGVQVYQHIFPSPPDPWVVLQSHDVSFEGRIENLRITGQPEIPERLDLIGVGVSHGWRADFYGEVIGFNDNAQWQFQGDKLTGSAKTNIHSAEDLESFIRYQRPMLEDGVVEYEFWYSVGKAEVHPTIAGDALIVRDGKPLEVHRLTNLSSQTENLLPDNRQSVEGAQTPTLKGDSWNQMRMELKGDELTIQVNGVSIATLPVKVPANQRHFGLFHYSNTEAQVRKLSYSGQWPKTLPTLQEQELAAGN